MISDYLGRRPVHLRVIDVVALAILRRNRSDVWGHHGFCCMVIVIQDLVPVSLRLRTGLEVVLRRKGLVWLMALSEDTRLVICVVPGVIENELMTGRRSLKLGCILMISWLWSHGNWIVMAAVQPTSFEITAISVVFFPEVLLGYLYQQAVFCIAFWRFDAGVPAPWASLLRVFGNNLLLLGINELIFSVESFKLDLVITGQSPTVNHFIIGVAYSLHKIFGIIHFFLYFLPS